MPKKGSSKKPAPVPENRVIKHNGSSAIPKKPGNEIYDHSSTKKRKTSEQEKAQKQVEDESAKANKLRKLKNKKIESKEKEYLDTRTRPREKPGDGFFVYTAEELVSRKSDAGGMQRWNAEVDKCFLDTCIQEVTKRGRRGGSLHTESWTTIMEVLNQNHNFVVSQRQMKNRYDYLKSKYQAWLTLKTSHVYGHVYDHRTNTINMKNSEWQEYIKAHPKAKSLRHAPLLYPDLCTTLFEGTIINGVDALGPNYKDQDRGSTSSSSNSRNVEQLDYEVDEHEGNSNPSNSKDQDLGIASPSSNSRNVQQLENGHIQDVEHEGNSNNPSSPGTHSKASIPPSQGDKPEKKKKYQPSSSQTNLEEAMSYALSFVLKNHRGPSVTDCITKLNEVGLDKDDDLYLSAVVIFGNSEGHREAWMNLPKDNVRLLTGWIKKVGHIMGLTF